MRHARPGGRFADPEILGLPFALDDTSYERMCRAGICWMAPGPHAPPVWEAFAHGAPFPAMPSGATALIVSTAVPVRNTGRDSLEWVLLVGYSDPPAVIVSAAVEVACWRARAGLPGPGPAPR